MNLSRSRSSAPRTLAATVLAAATLGAGLPAVAHADPGDVSVSITVVNNTNKTLKLDDLHADEGAWVHYPAPNIAKSGSNFIKTESSDDEGDTAGFVRYKSAKAVVEIRWENQYDGENSFSCKVPDSMICTMTGDEQSADANVKITVK